LAGPTTILSALEIKFFSLAEIDTIFVSFREVCKISSNNECPECTSYSVPVNGCSTGQAMTSHRAIPPLTPNRINYRVTKVGERGKMFNLFPSPPNLLYLKAGSDLLEYHYFTDIKRWCDNVQNFVIYSKFSLF
jgi:hypothetical protein